MNTSLQQHFTLNVTYSGGTALEHLHTFLLTQHNLSISKSTLKSYAQKGAVWLSRYPFQNKPTRLRRLKKVLTIHDRLDFYYAPKWLNHSPTPAKLIADFNDYSVWLKPRGMFSQGSKWADHNALSRWIEMHGLPSRQSWIVHRLDRATCGLMLIAHSKTMATQLSQLFEQKRIKKRYQANVWGTFPSTPQTFNTPVQTKPAISHVQQLKKIPPLLHPSHTLDSLSRVQIHIETGRKHQIRIHLSQAGYPIIGDRLYGNSALNRLCPNLDLQLSADQMEFICPLTQTLRKFTLTETQCNLYPSLSPPLSLTCTAND